MPSIPRSDWSNVARLYQSGLPMRVVAEKYAVSIDAVTYVLRKLNIPRRSLIEANRLAYKAKKPSFLLRKRNKFSREMDIAGAMLYWAEGYKTVNAMNIDFANSDPEMAELFMKFLYTRYILDPNKLRLRLYCYSDQNISSIIKFWSKKLRVPISQFSKPYVRTDFKIGGKKLLYGVIHICYFDKKLLIDVLNLIDFYKSRYASVAEWSIAVDCKSTAFWGYAGSNPARRKRSAHAAYIGG